MAVFLPATGSTGTNIWYWHSTASWFNPTGSTIGVATNIASFQQATALPGLNDEVFLVTPWTLRQTMNVSLRAMTGSLRVKKIHQRTTGSWTTVCYLPIIDFDSTYNVIEATNGIVTIDSNVDGGGNFIGIGATNIHSGINLTISASIWAGGTGLNPVIPINVSNSTINISGSIYQSSALTGTVSSQVNGVNNTINIYGDVVGGVSTQAVNTAGVISIASSYNTLNVYGNLYNSSSVATAGSVINISDTYVGNVINVYGGTFRPITSINNLSVVTTLNALRSNMESRAGSPLIRIQSTANPTVSNIIVLGTPTVPITMYNSGTGSLVLTATPATTQIASTVDTRTQVFLYINSYSITATGSKTQITVPRLYVSASNITVATSSDSNSKPITFTPNTVSDTTTAPSNVFQGTSYGLSTALKTGTLIVPNVVNVRSGSRYSSGSISGGVFTYVPATGSCNVPSNRNVRLAVLTDVTPSGGLMVVPIASQVSNSKAFDSYGSTGTYSGSKDFWATPHNIMTTGIGALISQSLNVRAGSVTGSLVGTLNTDTSNTVTRLRSIAGVADMGNSLTQSANI